MKRVDRPKKTYLVLVILVLAIDTKEHLGIPLEPLIKGQFKIGKKAN